MRARTTTADVKVGSEELTPRPRAAWPSSGSARGRRPPTRAQARLGRSTRSTRRSSRSRATPALHLPLRVRGRAAERRPRRRAPAPARGAGRRVRPPRPRRLQLGRRAPHLMTREALALYSRSSRPGASSPSRLEPQPSTRTRRGRHRAEAGLASRIFDDGRQGSEVGLALEPGSPSRARPKTRPLASDPNWPRFDPPSTNS